MKSREWKELGKELKLRRIAFWVVANGNETNKLLGRDTGGKRHHPAASHPPIEGIGASEEEGRTRM
jgi:hypothetical protein